ncbi:hypothetical protein [Paenibacillus pabuli]|nr:hypothetical protein [Paenibacillus pabuli]MEC0128921.1 hypothetical protein [Paenibacillus pabuli]
MQDRPVALVTGANKGIGFQDSQPMWKRGTTAGRLCTALMPNIYTAWR